MSVMRIGVLLYLLLAAGVSTMTAGIFSGRVRDGTTYEPLAGASITLQDTEYGAVTDMNGYFLISAPAETAGVVRVAYLGFSDLLVSITSNGNSPASVETTDFYVTPSATATPPPAEMDTLKEALKGLTAVRITTNPGFAKADALSPGLKYQMMDRFARSLKMAGIQATSDSACPASVDVQLDCESTTAGLLYNIRFVFRQTTSVSTFEAALTHATSAVIPRRELAREVSRMTEVCINNLANLWRVANAQPIIPHPTLSLDDFYRPWPAMAPAIKLIIEMDAQRRRKELRRLFGARELVTTCGGVGIDPFWANFWWMYCQEDIRPVLARDIRDFGWDRTLDRVPGVVIR
jgi:hypothetical protein